MQTQSSGAETGEGGERREGKGKGMEIEDREEGQR